jgi:glucose/arabinose dehydrogenase
MPMLIEMRRAAILAAVMLLSVACSGERPQTINPSPSTPSSSPSATTSSPSPSPSPGPANLSKVQLRLVKVATLEAPLAMATRAGDEALYIAEKGGRVRALRGGKVDPDAVLDISGQVSLGGEQGLLGLAFSPDGSFLYVNYTDTAGDTRIVEYEMGGRRANAGSAREVLSVNQPFSNHNGGNLAFGPDGYLYAGLGDGGSGGDPQDNGQSLSARLGKMLRIDPRPSDGGQFGVPPANPFRRREGADPLIWAYGLRNPWRYSFDRVTGDLWIGDVGQSIREEIDFQPAASAGGENYGWARIEGTQPYSGVAPPDAVRPVEEYPTADGCAVTGGYVYRGSAIPNLYGAYLYGDFCAGFVRGIVLKGRNVMQRREFGITVSSLASFGEDQDGELYALSLGGDVYRIDPA